MSEAMIWLLLRGVWETLAMTFVLRLFRFCHRLPVGVLLYVTRRDRLLPTPNCTGRCPRWLTFSVPSLSLSCWCG
ncbi:D-methionine transport system permease protein metI [Raoultella planticola]|uniref:D-methionine transport system permease protein metI n=1 Tax=Raoultella planticola TaxID=575 RepID=A0A485B0Y5_RAOPL|nr:D-methionine transport system permease protein metI [Raoultella planticola]